MLFKSATQGSLSNRPDTACWHILLQFSAGCHRICLVAAYQIYHLCFGIVLRTGNIQVGPDGTTSDVSHSCGIAYEFGVDNEV